MRKCNFGFWLVLQFIKFWFNHKDKPVFLQCLGLEYRKNCTFWVLAAFSHEPRHPIEETGSHSLKSLNLFLFGLFFSFAKDFL